MRAFVDAIERVAAGRHGARRRGRLRAVPQPRRPRRRRRARRAHAARARGHRADGRGPHERRHRTRARGHGRRRREAHLLDLRASSTCRPPTTTTAACSPSWPTCGRAEPVELRDGSPWSPAPPPARAGPSPLRLGAEGAHVVLADVDAGGGADAAAAIAADGGRAAFVRTDLTDADAVARADRGRRRARTAARARQQRGRRRARAAALPARGRRPPGARRST